MKQRTGRKLLGVLLALALVLGLVPGMSLTAYAANNIGVGTTWYIGDSLNLAGKYVHQSGTGYEPTNFILCGDNTHTVLPPVFKYDAYTNRYYWIFEGLLFMEGSSVGPNLQIDCPDGKTSSDKPTGILRLLRPGQHQLLSLQCERE